MIVRSGLIQRRDQIGDEDFRRHWVEVHGPLALKLPNLRGYAQNLVTDRGRASAADGLHRIDGLSQLWFDDVDHMVTGMSSPENDACVTDIGRFLSKVTLVVQRAARWRRAEPSTRQYKLMAVFVGAGPFDRIEAAVSGSMATCASQPLAWRINSIADGSFIVDRTVPRDDAPLVAVLEAFFPDAETRSAFMSSAVLEHPEFAPAAVLAVAETVLLAPPVSF